MWAQVKGFFILDSLPVHRKKILALGAFFFEIPFVCAAPAVS